MKDGCVTAVDDQNENASITLNAMGDLKVKNADASVAGNSCYLCEDPCAIRNRNSYLSKIRFRHGAPR